MVRAKLRKKWGAGKGGVKVEGVDGFEV